MRRDMNLCRDILKKAGQDEAVLVKMNSEDFPGVSRQHFIGHLVLLRDAGLIDDVLPMVQLTWAGNEFLDLAQNNQVWRQALDRIRDLGLSPG